MLLQLPMLMALTLVAVFTGHFFNRRNGIEGAGLASRGTVRYRRREMQGRKEKAMSLGTLLLIVVVLLLIGAVPSWPYSRSWGYGPSGILGVVVLIVVLLVVMGRI